MSDDHSFSVEVQQVEDFKFTVDFGLDGVDDLLLDEPAPLGGGAGPNASRVLAAAIGNCLCASLLFCLRRARAEVSGIGARVSGSWVRNEEGRWRIKEMEVEINPSVEEEHASQLERCAEIFEQFCVASQSVRDGIEIKVKVKR
jgi:organic hydroperoxide reductase OsmC/OhrA